MTDESSEFIDGYLDGGNEYFEPADDDRDDEIIDEGAIEPVAQTAIMPYQLSGNAQLAGRLGGLMGDINAAARASVEQTIREGNLSVTVIEREAMVQVEAFRQTGGLGLTEMCLRVHYLREIQRRNLLAAHPAQYRNLDEMAADNGCSKTELLASLDLVNIVFPYVESELDIPVWNLWEQVGKSKLKEMLPVLKSIISGDRADTETTRNSVQRILDDMAASMANAEAYQELFTVAQNEDVPQDERQEAFEQINRAARRMAVGHLIEVAQNVPTEELRRHLRPERTPPAQFVVVRDGEDSYITAQLTPEQLQMVQRALRERIEIVSMDLPEDPHTRQVEAFRVGPLRRLYERVFGGRR